MKDLENNPESTSNSEHEPNEKHIDQLKQEKPADDAFKTAGKKHKQEWTEPLDEQQFDDQNLSDKEE